MVSAQDREYGGRAKQRIQKYPYTFLRDQVWYGQEALSTIPINWVGKKAYFFVGSVVHGGRVKYLADQCALKPNCATTAYGLNRLRRGLHPTSRGKWPKFPIGKPEFLP